MSTLLEAQMRDVRVRVMEFPSASAAGESTGHGIVMMPEPRREERDEAALDAAREEGRLVGRQELVAATEEKLREALAFERAAVTNTCNAFVRAREAYFADLEREVVQLALAIAGRVVQRELQLDPTLLEGVVHTALAKLRSTEGVRLYCSAEDAARWRRSMKSAGIEVVSADSMESGEVRLEAETGTVELGVKAQIIEIERGLCDLMDRRTGAMRA